MLRSGVRPDKILVLAFTNRAIVTFRNQLVERIGPELTAHLQLFTFHSFCQMMLASSSDLLSVSQGWRVADEVDSLVIADRSINSGILKEELAHFGPAAKKTTPLDIVRAVRALKRKQIANAPGTVQAYETRILDVYNQYLNQSNMLDVSVLSCLSSKAC
jgi:ATP-dependent helicase/nuclease subunit A